MEGSELRRLGEALDAGLPPWVDPRPETVTGVAGHAAAILDHFAERPLGYGLTEQKAWEALFQTLVDDGVIEICGEVP